MTIREAIAKASDQLAGVGVDLPRGTAQLLLASLLEKDRTFILTHPNEEVEPITLHRFQDWVKQRASGVPVQYLTGHQEFFGLDFIVAPAVLIPRPETELIVEEVLSLNHKRAPFIIDVGTGSGCLAVTLAKELACATIVALDISEASLRLARINAKRHGVEDRVWFLASDLLSSLLPGRGGIEADFIVANPPYVAVEEYEGLPVEVRAHEPRVALLAGEDGSRIHRRILRESGSFLHADGALVMEIGFGQAETLINLIPSGWRLQKVTSDIQGHPRVFVLHLTAQT